jgi:uncharacterized protein (DUF885 family)
MHRNFQITTTVLAILDQLSEIHSGLRAYDRDSLSRDQQLSYDVLDWLLETQEAGRPFLYPDYPLNQFDGAQSGLPDFLVNIHQVDDEADARNHLARIAKFELALEQMSASVRARCARSSAAAFRLASGRGRNNRFRRHARRREYPLQQIRGFPRRNLGSARRDALGIIGRAEVSDRRNRPAGIPTTNQGPEEIHQIGLAMETTNTYPSSDASCR